LFGFQTAKIKNKYFKMPVILPAKMMLKYSLTVEIKWRLHVAGCQSGISLIRKPALLGSVLWCATP
jgi:hypothetical protein